MTKQEREAARERCERATPGPWVYPVGGAICSDSNGETVFCGEGSQADHIFIAAARADLPKALAVIEECVKGLDKIIHELGVPQPGYPQPVANAYEIAKSLLERLE